MKKFLCLTALFALISIQGCQQVDLPEDELQKSTLYLTIENNEGLKTRTEYAQSGDAPTQGDDNTINTLEVFIFHNTGAAANNGKLDTYKKFAGTELASLSNLAVSTTTGNKDIYVIANSHRANWTGITTLSDFQGTISSIKDENLKNFVMTGNTTQNLTITSTATFNLSRLVSRIELKGIKTNFAGTPYAGKTLSEVKVYLLNVNGDKRFFNGSAPATPNILNHKHSVATDAAACTISGMIYDSLTGTIGEGTNAYSKIHYYYCYENTLENETADNRFTRLVIECKLDGINYYYPISINREGFGYSSGTKGVQRNHWYIMDVTILRPGSLDPDIVLEKGSISVTVTANDWDKIDIGNQEF